MEKAPKIFAHVPLQKKQQQPPSFIQKRGEQTFFSANHTIDTAAVHPFIQPKLQISKPGDPFEQEADQQADKVMRMTEPVKVVATPTAPPPNDELQPKEAAEIQPKMYVNSGGILVQCMEEEEAYNLKKRMQEQYSIHLQPGSSYTVPFFENL